MFTSSVRCIQSCEMRRIISIERTLVNIATYGAEFSSYEQDVAILVHTVWQLTLITRVFHSLYKVGRNGNFVFKGFNNSKKKVTLQWGSTWCYRLLLV